MSSAVLFRQRTAELEAWLALRRERGLDRRDEVWEGMYVVNPVPRLGHAKVASRLFQLLRPAALAAGLDIVLEVNVGEPDDFRIPDVTVLPAGLDEDTVYVPSVVVAVEVLSPGDRWDEKLPFYLRRGVPEVVIVDQKSRTVRWLTAGPDGWNEVERSEALGIDVAAVVAAAWP